MVGQGVGRVLGRGGIGAVGVVRGQQWPMNLCVAKVNMCPMQQRPKGAFIMYEKEGGRRMRGGGWRQGKRGGGRQQVGGAR